MATKTKTLKAERVKLDGESTMKIKEMLLSGDKENHTVGLAIIDQCDVKEELPYLLVLYKHHGDKNQEEWKTGAPVLMKAFKDANIKLDSPNITFNTLFNISKKKYPQAVQFILDEFCKELVLHIGEWGMTLINEVNVKITPKE